MTDFHQNVIILSYFPFHAWIKGALLPQRVVLGIMGFLGIVVSFLMRQCLSIAITEMVVPVNNTGTSNDSLICPADYSTVQHANNSQQVCYCHIFFGATLWTWGFSLSSECKKIRLVTRAARMGSIGIFRGIFSFAHSRWFASATLWWQMDIGFGCFDNNHLQCGHTSSS